MIETWDGCYEDMEWPDDIDADEQTAIEEAVDEGDYFSALQDNDWLDGETEMWIWGPILIEGNNNFRKVIIADEEGKVVEFEEAIL